MKKSLAIFIAAILVVSSLLAVTVSADSTENGIKSAMGNANADAKYTVKIDMPAEYEAGDEIEAVVTIADLKDEKLAFVGFEIRYDAKELQLLNEGKRDGSLDFVTKVPEGWENLTKFTGSDSGTITVSLIITEYESFPENDGDITLTLKFKVLDAAKGKIGVYVPHATVKGSNWDKPDAQFAGNGAYALSDAKGGESEPEDPEAEKETITVDGTLDDNGWAADGWTTVSKDNGAFQGGIDSLTAEASKDFSYKFQMRTDDTKLYVAAIYDVEERADCPDGGAGTKLRLWLNTNPEATVYTHFYDLYLAGDELKVAGKMNTALDANKAALIENSSVAGAITVADGKVMFELSVDLEEFGGEDGFKFFFNGGHKIEGDNIQLLYPAVEIPEEGNKNINFPYSTWAADKAADADVDDMKLGTVPVVDPKPPVVDPDPTPDATEEAIKAAMGEANADAKYIVKVDMTDEYKVGDEIEAVVTITDITDEKLAYVEFKLCYDATELKLLNGANDDGSLDFVTKLPDEKWENLTAAKDSENGTVTVILMINDYESFPKNDGDITLTLKFKVLDTASGKIGVYVPHASVNGSNWDNPNAAFAGNGSYVLADVKGDDTSSGDSSDDSSNDSSEASGNDSSEPETKPGDASAMIIFAIIAIVAIAGSAVVIKSRR